MDHGPNTRFCVFGGLEVSERLDHEIDVGEIREECIRLVSEKFFGRVKTSGADRDRACSKMPRTVNVIGRVADDDELLGGEVELKMFADTFSGLRGQIAAVV